MTSEQAVVIDFNAVAGGAKYKFVNATNLTVTSANTDMSVSVDLIDAITGTGVSGEDVSISTIDSKYGSISPSTIQTNKSGKAIFTYTSPAKLVKGTATATLRYVDNSGVAITKDITIAVTPPVGGAKYKFVNATNLTVTSANAPYTISVDLIDTATGVGVPNENVTISTISNVYGSIASSTVQTDSAGKASFAYTSPVQLTAGTETATLSYTDSNGQMITTTINIVVTPPAGGTQYSFINATNLNVTAANAPYTISVDLIDTATGVGVPNENVTISTISNVYGSIASSTVHTDSAGKASFAYTSPVQLTAGTETATLSYTDSNGQTITTTINIVVTPPTGGAGFKIAKVTNPILIDTNSQQKEIVVTVVDSANNVPAKDQTVQIASIEQGYGDIITTTTVQTDDTGRAIFRYEAPSDISVLTRDSNVSIYLLDNNSVVDTKVATLTFKPKAGVQVSQIYIQPDVLNVQTNSKDYKVKITALDTNNYGVVSHFKIQNPVFGSFDKSEFDTDSSGNAELIYTSPNDIIGVQDRNITVTDTVSQKSEQFLIKFIQPNVVEKFYELELSTTDSVSVEGNTILGVAIHKAGDKTTLISSSDVKNVSLIIKHTNLLLFENNATNVSYIGEASKSYRIFAQKLSGVAIVEASAIVYNGVSNVTITQTFPVVIMSGPLASMSIFHVNSELNSTSGLYKDIYTVHAVDKYGNPVREGTTLHPSLVNGVKVKKLGSGKIIPGSITTFEDNASFASTTIADRLIIMPSASKKDNSYLGNWSISSATSNILNLTEVFGGSSSVSGLNYVVGNEKRVIKNANGVDQLVTADISSSTGKYETDASGHMQFMVNYDPLLKGEKFYVSANGDSNGKRIGISLETIFYYGGYKILLPFSDIYVSSPLDTFSMNFTILDALGQVANDTTDLNIPHFEVKYGSILIDNNKDLLEYTAPASITQFNGTTYDFNVTISGAEEMYQTVSVHFNVTPDVNTSTMNLTAVPKELNITTSNDSRVISLYLEDNATHKAVADAEIQAVFFDPSKGTLDNYSALTDGNGKVVFTYTTPGSIPSGSFPITFKVAKATQLLDANVTVNFSNAYQLKTVVDDIYIEANPDNTPQYNTAQKVGFYVLDHEGNKVFDLFTVKVDTYDTRYGQVIVDNTNPASNTGTSLDGYFLFTPPSDLTGLIGTTYDFNMTIAEPEGKGVVHTVRVHYGNAGTVDTTGMILRSTTDNINVTSPAEEKDIVLYLIDSNNMAVQNTAITASLFDENNGTLFAYSATTDTHGKVTFTYKAAQTILNGSFPITFAVANGLPVLDKNITVNMGNAVIPPVDTTNMKLYPIPSELNITVADESRVISLYLEDTSSNAPIANVAIKADFFDPASGTLNSYEVTTNINGQAVFNYTAPATFPAADVNITFDVVNADPATPSVAKNVDVKFVTTSTPPVDTTDLNLTVLPSDINITTAGEQRVISVYLEDTSTQTPKDGVAIKANFFDPASGTLNSYEVTTNGNGQAVFNYTAPATFPATDVNITFDVVNADPATPSVAQTVDVKFVTVTTPPVDTTNMNLTAAPDTVYVSKSGDSTAITLYLSNTNGPVANTNIKANWFDPNSGTLNNYTATTSAAGQVVFNYTSPAVLPASDLNITFKVLNGSPTLDTNVTVKFNEPPVDTTNLKLQAVPDTIYVADSYSKYIDLYLDDNSTGKAVEGQKILAEVFDRNKGTLLFYSVTTDAGGHAQFLYDPPSTLPTSDLNITFKVLNGSPDRKAVVTVKFNEPPVPTANLKLQAVPDTIYVTSANGLETIGLYLDNNATGKPVAGQKIIAHIFDRTKGRLFSYSETTDESGYVSFYYDTPDTLPISDLNITFEVANGSPAKTEIVTLKFNEPPVDTTNLKLQAVPDTIYVTSANGLETIGLYLDNNATGKPVAGQKIIAHIFDRTKGRLFSYSETTDESGYVSFYYDTPDTLPTSDLNITFEVANGSPAKTEIVTLKFNEPPVPTANLKLQAVPDTIYVADTYGETIGLYLDNNATGKPVAGQKIIAHIFDRTKGRLLSYSQTTDESGYVSFYYDTPDTLPTSDLNITFEVANGSPAKTEIVTLKFNEPPVPTANLKLQAVPDTIYVTSANGLETIGLYLDNNATGKPVAGQKIIAHIFDRTKGRLFSYSETTDESGYVSFYYDTPDTLPTSDLNITFEVANGSPDRKAVVTVKFNEPPVDTTNLKLQAVPSDINITTAGEQRVISVYLEDTSTHSPKDGVAIKANFFDPASGTLNSYEVPTNANGQAVFNYTAPATLPSGNIQVTFDVENAIGAEGFSTSKVTWILPLGNVAGAV